jgi:hypothetical protein
MAQQTGKAFRQAIAIVVWLVTAAHAQEQRWPVRVLTNAEVITLETKSFGRFDASGLWRTRTGEWLTINDREPTLYQLQVPDGKLTVLKQLSKTNRYDCEGIAEDESGRIYVCEESERLILRWDRKRDTIERLPIDWSGATKYFSSDRNASFEGVAVGGDNLYVANERMFPRILVVDLRAMRLIDDFLVEPITFNLLGLHYSDLSWFDRHLYVLCRQNQVVLEVDPESHDVLAEFDYKNLEDKLGYKKEFPVGYMEGLAIDREFIWLLIDNNGAARKGNDTRPVLLKCRR